MKILDIGCGNKKIEGSIGIDKEKNENVDVVHDLNKFPYPLKNNEFDVIHASHIMEHLNDTVKVMEELYRILKPNGKLIIKVPCFAGSGAWGNPTHAKAFTIFSFDYFNKSWKKYGSDAFNTKCNFKIVKREFRYFGSLAHHNILLNAFGRIIDFFANLNHEFCQRFWCYLVGGFNEMYFELKAIKG